MHKLAYNYIFQNAFDTFKVFETITYKSFGIVIEGHSKSIWQILNHIILWQSFQINQITNTSSKYIFNEENSWIKDISPNNKKECQSKINEFNIQITSLKNIISSLDDSNQNLSKDLKILQEISTHLSFHLGEIILIGRLLNVYPKPHEMNAFLNN